MAAKVVTGFGIAKGIASVSVSSLAFSQLKDVRRALYGNDKHVEGLEQLLKLSTPTFRFDDVVG